MNRRKFVRTIGITAALTVTNVLCLADDGTIAAERLNVVLIVCDDLGWRDTAVYGSTFYETPNIDALAASGMRFTDACSANPLCSPTRASILTGQYPLRHGLTTAAGHIAKIQEHKEHHDGPEEIRG
ncbi:MAG TPA: hypothetical protein DCS43_13690, partial [Verrucomicrobia bacterium]|nr:hypothetical protein [Verrucomicrobiota bacterium]